MVEPTDSGAQVRGANDDKEAGWGGKPGAQSVVGITFEFLDVGREILFVLERGSSREYVFVDGECIAELNSWATTSTHRFEIDGDAYVITLTTPGHPRAVLSCLLSKNGSLVARKRAVVGPQGNKTSLFITLLAWCALGFAVSAVGLDSWWLLLGGGVGLVYVLVTRARLPFEIVDVRHGDPLVTSDRIGQLRAKPRWHRGLLRIGRNLSSGFRLALGIRSRLTDFRTQPFQLVALVVIAFAIPLVIDYFQSEPPRVFFHWALMYHATIYFALFGAIFCTAHWIRLSHLVRWITVALLAVSIWSGALFIFFIESFTQAVYEERWVYLSSVCAGFAAWGLLYTSRVLQAASGLTIRRLIAPLTVLVVVSVGIRFVLPYSPFWYTDYEEATEQYQPVQLPDTEAIYYRQPQLLEQSLEALAPELPGVADLYFVGFGSYASQDVFMKETAYVQQSIERHFVQHGRAINLINNTQTVHDTPVATVSNLAAVLEGVGRRMDVDNDVLFLYLTSHGSRDGVLSVQYYGLNPQQLDAESLREMLDQSAIRWRIVVVSACYSGSFIEALKNPHTLVLTAAHKDRTSFGCSNDRELTYFAEHLFQQELLAGGGLLSAFARARESLTKREQREGHLPSEPQLFLGDAMREKLSLLEARAFGAVNR